MSRLFYRKGGACLTVALAGLFPLVAAADGTVVSKIYDPYVQPLETEIEWRFVDQQQNRSPDTQEHLLGFGRSLSDRWAIELYAVAQKGLRENLSVDAYEVELKWQLTGQGEYAVDWGVLFELERGIEENAWELSTQLLASRDFGRVTTTANFGIILERGERIRNEIETTFRAQARYRLQEAFEPVFEIHLGQDTEAAGPAITGLVRMSRGRKLRWELGVFAGLDGGSSHRIVKANVEFEF